MHGHMHRTFLVSVGLGLLCALSGGVSASELVYTPVNPSFGGNPLNGAVLMNQATAQNKFKESIDSGDQSALTQFNTMLQSAILSRVSSAVTSSIVGADGSLTPGTVETTDFRITITNLQSGLLQITTTDKSTGQTTQFQVNQP
jgi:curli production assembly/transport component CsgF